MTKKTVEILERTESYDLVKVTPVGGLEGVNVMSGEEISRTDESIMLKLKQNDGLLIDDVVILLWNKEKGCFERQ